MYIGHSPTGFRFTFYSDAVCLCY